MADPIHGILRFDRRDETHRLVLEVVNCRAFQRLRRIRQMGMAEFVFPGAVHSRFAHSLGATYLMVKTLEYLEHSLSAKPYLEAEYEGVPVRRLLLLGILLHDIGHTPLSHTLEALLELHEQGLSHEHYWVPKLITEDPELQGIWQKYDPRLPHALLKFMGHDSEGAGGEKHFLASLVSSQLDLDRLDFLLRDSHFLGVTYGHIEADRILTSLDIDCLPDGSPVIVVADDALPAVEHYLFCRHQAYKMALHPLDKASEALLKKTLDRFRWAREQGIETGHPAEELFQLMTKGHTLSLASFLRMDDCYLWEAIHHWSLASADPLLKTLADRLMRHDLLKFVDLAKYGHTGLGQERAPVYDALRRHYQERGLDFEFGFEETLVQPKPLYSATPEKQPIWIRLASGAIVDLAEVSSLPMRASEDVAEEALEERGVKRLLFVWDGQAKRCLLEALNHSL